MNDRLVFQKYCFNSFVSCYPKLSKYIATSLFNINGNPIQFLLTSRSNFITYATSFILHKLFLEQTALNLCRGIFSFLNISQRL